MYRLLFTKNLAEQLKNIDHRYRVQLLNLVLKLAQSPHAYGAERGLQVTYCAYLDAFQIWYDIDDYNKNILIYSYVLV